MTLNWLHWLCFDFVFLVFILAIYLLAKNGTKQLKCNFSWENLPQLHLLIFIVKCSNYACIRNMISCIFHYISNKASSSHKPRHLLAITTLFLLSILLLCGSRFLMKSINFSGLKSLYLFQSRRSKSFKIWVF